MCGRIPQRLWSASSSNLHPGQLALCTISRPFDGISLCTICSTHFAVAAVSKAVRVDRQSDNQLDEPIPNTGGGQLVLLPCRNGHGVGGGSCVTAYHVAISV
jgi:hypothetical protein